ncbi:MAG: tetratricopeptide repeat protein [Anaerolineae bacterium]
MDIYKQRQNFPRQPETTILRPRLLTALRGIHKHRLTLVTAPPGYGKTTLVAQYLEQSNAVAAWHTIEPRERDLPNLFEHCISVISPIVPQVVALKFRPRSTPDEMAIQITEVLRYDSDAEVVYVLDDAHELLGSLASEAWLRSFIRTLPQNWHVVLISRLPPNLSLTDMVARREVFALQSEQLRFNYGEISELATRLGVRVSVAQMEWIDTVLAGWPAGAILALQPLPDEIEQILLTGKTDAETMFEVMVTAYLETLSLPLRHFLFASSILTRFTPELCKKVLGLHKSVTYITEVEAHHLFISHGQGGMNYHALFRDVLQKQFREHNPSAFHDLHRRAGEWYEQQQSFDEAFNHYIAADEFDRAAALAEVCAQPYYNQGNIESVLQWARKLHSYTRPCPNLRFTNAMICFMRYQYEDARNALEQALADFETQQDHTGWIQVRLLQASIHNHLGEYDQAVKLTQNLILDAALPENLRGLGLANLGTAHLNLGQTTSGVEYLEAALAIYRTVNDSYSLSQLLHQLEVAYLQVGRFDDATLCIQEISSIQRDLDNATGLAFSLNNLGYHYHMVGLYQQAQACFEEGMHIAARLSDKRAEAYLDSSMAELLRDRGSWGDALSLYQKALEINGRDEPSLRCSLLLNMSTLYRWQGQSEEALAFAQEALELATKQHLPITADKAELLLLATHIRFGESLPGTEKLNQIASRFQEHQAVPDLILAYGIMTHFAVRQSNLKEADTYLRRALGDALHPANLHHLIAEIVHNDDLQRLIKQQTFTYEALLQGIKIFKALKFHRRDNRFNTKQLP